METPLNVASEKSPGHVEFQELEFHSEVCGRSFGQGQAEQRQWSTNVGRAETQVLQLPHRWQGPWHPLTLRPSAPFRMMIYLYETDGVFLCKHRKKPKSQLGRWFPATPHWLVPGTSSIAFLLCSINIKPSVYKIDWCRTIQCWGFFESCHIHFLVLKYIKVPTLLSYGFIWGFPTMLQ